MGVEEEGERDTHAAWFRFKFRVAYVQPQIQFQPPAKPFRFAAKLHPSRTYYYRKHADLDRLVEQCSKRLEKDADSVKALSIRASCLVKKKDWARALADYDRLHGLQGGSVTLFYHRGMCNERLSHLDDAIRDYTSVLELDPDHVNAAYARGSCHNLKGNFGRAIEDYNHALLRDKVKGKTQGGAAGARRSPSSNRKGSFLVGANEYVIRREQEVRERIAKGLTPKPATIASALSDVPGGSTVATAILEQPPPGGRGGTR